MSQPRLKGILFDMDDTLITWEDFDGDWHTFEQSHTSAVYGFVCGLRPHWSTDYEIFHDRYREAVRDAWGAARTTLRAPHIGQLLLEVLHEMGVTPGADITVDTCLDAYQWGSVPGVRVFPDVPGVLGELKARGLQLGIVTNASQPMRLRDHELRAYGLMDYFADSPCRLAAADVGYLKPHRNIFSRALELMGTTPEETLFVGDNPVADIAGAQSAGMRAVLRINGTPPPLISGLIVPDYAVHDLHELLLVLDELYPTE